MQVYPNCAGFAKLTAGTRPAIYQRRHLLRLVPGPQTVYDDPILRSKTNSCGKEVLPVRILGIETSCDETAAAVIQDGELILANIVFSQIDIHRPFGGVFPEVAARQHILAIDTVIDLALQEAICSLADIDAVAVTSGPGLVGSLLVGVNAAKGIALATGLPLMGVNHLEGHIYSNWTRPLGPAGESWRPPDLPALLLIVSGGHTDLVLMPEHGVYRPLGHTIDDAAGEAFDKVARLLGLSYPGGPAIQQVALQGRHDAFALPVAHLDGYNFSFSGLKTALLRQVQQLERAAGVKIDPARRLKTSHAELLTPQQVADLAASFQWTLVQTLVERTVQAAAAHDVAHVCVCGGVSANTLLRRQMAEALTLPVSFPPLYLCTDNAAMIGVAGSYAFRRGEISGLDMDVVARPPWPVRQPSTARG